MTDADILRRKIEWETDSEVTGTFKRDQIATHADALALLKQCADYLDCIPETAAGGDDEAGKLARAAYIVIKLSKAA